MAINGEAASQSANGRSPDQERRRASGGFVATSSTATDRRARNEHVSDLAERVSACDDDCTNTRGRITAAEEHRDAIPDHLRGWPIEIVVVLAAISVFFEYVPASMFTLVFTTAKNDLQLRLLTIAFTVIGALLALCLGELLRRGREPARHSARETMLTRVVTLSTLGFLVIGYFLRIAYTGTTQNGDTVLAPQVEAIALTAIAAVGIALTVVSSYFREGIESLRVRWQLRRLRAELATFESHLVANQRDLKRARESAAHDGERRVTPDPKRGEGSQPVH